MHSSKDAARRSGARIVRRERGQREMRRRWRFARRIVAVPSTKLGHPTVDMVVGADYKQPAPTRGFFIGCAGKNMDQTPIVSLAAGHPLIDIDGTVIVQFVLFLVLFAVSNRFLFQPYLRLRERRTAGIEGARGEAERMTAQ